MSALLSSQASSAQLSQAAGQHRHGAHHHAKSISDVDAQSSSVASPSSTGKIGGTLDVTV
jgi:hypothetical protein